MAHVLTVGTTLCGKTTLNKKLARQLKAQGIGVLVLDELCDPEWNADFQTSDPDEFLRVVWDSERCACFIDEAGDAVGRYNDAMRQTATRGRHFGHRFFYITQRSADLGKTVRDQCTTLYLFLSSTDDCKLHSKEWVKPELVNGVTLGQGEYFTCGRFTPILRGNIFDDTAF